MLVSHLVKLKITVLGTAASTKQMRKTTELGISYAVASGVTANLGWKMFDSTDDGSSETSGGNSWYVGANMSF